MLQKQDQLSPSLHALTRLSDTGPYNCEVSVSSVYLAESITRTSNTLNVSLQVSEVSVNNH